MSNPIVAKLKDLLIQPNYERNTYDIEECCKAAIEEIELMRAALIAMIELSETGVAAGIVNLHPDLEPVRVYMRRGLPRDD